MEAVIKNKTMYTIGQDLIELYNQLEENGGELTPEMETALEISQTDLQLKAVDYCNLTKEISSQVAALDKEIERLTNMRDVKKRLIDRLKGNVKAAMEHFNIHKIEMNNVRISLRPFTAIQITDESLLPEDCFTEKVVRTVSKTAIKDILEAADIKEIPGAKQVTNYSLQIK